MAHSRFPALALALAVTATTAAQGPRPLPLGPGDPFPELTVYDAAGNPFDTRSLAGQYTVVVSGCLT